MDNNKRVYSFVTYLHIRSQTIFFIGQQSSFAELSDLHNLKTKLLECSSVLKGVTTSIYAWLEILENWDQIIKDSNNLQQLRKSLLFYIQNNYIAKLHGILCNESSKVVLLRYDESISAEYLQIKPFQIGVLWNYKDYQVYQIFLGMRKTWNQTIINIINEIADETRDIIKQCSDSLEIIV
ncbi:unnamed protein product [Paramecium octaurelia]|uniref:Uncharacterized protein n=1 Tax=Paramecium octaurelia TaxID=43137 RepID=A0A8S1T438_PAROT|nr:unnamed protein product [Paramecium octaurelia]